MSVAPSSQRGSGGTKLQFPGSERLDMWALLTTSNTRDLKENWRHAQTFCVWHLFLPDFLLPTISPVWCFQNIFWLHFHVFKFILAVWWLYPKGWLKLLFFLIQVGTKTSSYRKQYFFLLHPRRCFIFHTFFNHTQHWIDHSIFICKGCCYLLFPFANWSGEINAFHCFTVTRGPFF